MPVFALFHKLIRTLRHSENNIFADFVTLCILIPNERHRDNFTFKIGSNLKELWTVFIKQLFYCHFNIICVGRKSQCCYANTIK